MTAFAVFGIHNTGLNLAVKLVILFLVVIWLALLYWTYADARRRIADPLIVGVATAACVFPFIGTIVYMIVRPPEYLSDVRERELEMQAAEARLAELGYHLCPHCDYEVEKDFLRCPNCMRKLKDPCHNCGRPLEPKWRVCPYCEADVGGIQASAPRRSRRRRETAGDGPATATPAPVAGTGLVERGGYEAPPEPRGRLAERTGYDGSSERGGRLVERTGLEAQADPRSGPAAT
jgi:RNA polymerase subunit RPABC4/transcription elongation factor Spt4